MVIGIVLFFTLTLFSLAFSEESFTVTTYYPSPYGSYNELYVAGNVGIGTTNPRAKLQVVDGAIWIGTSDTAVSFPNNLVLVGDYRGWSVAGGQFTIADWSWLAAGPYRIYAFNGVRTDGDIIVDTGNVGIGTVNPGSYKLNVNGNANISSTLTANKVTTNIIDPIFNINNKKYATYVSDFAGGLRIETSGLADLQLMEAQPLSDVKVSEYGYTINFNSLKEGSDLWLFWQASNKKLDAVSVLLSPNFEGKAWYKKEEERIIIYGDQEGEVSYRLSAPRVDHQKWGNLAEDQTLEGIDVSEYEKK